MIQLYFCKKNFETQKAERWFSERRIPVQKVDLTRARLSRREIDVFIRQTGLDALVDRESKAWKENPARYAGDSGAVIDALLKRPDLLKFPIVRNGNRVTVGYRPDCWADWSAALQERGKDE